MAFTIDNLRAFATAGEVVGSSPIRNQRIWGYTSNDALATIAGSGYFNNAAKYLGIGDVIMAVGVMNGTQVGEHYIVATNDGTTVTTIAFS